MPLGQPLVVQLGGLIELIKVFVTVSTDVTAWFVPSAKYMIRLTGSKEARSKLPAALVQPGTGITPTVFRLAFGVGVWACRTPSENDRNVNTVHCRITVFFIRCSPLSIGSETSGLLLAVQTRRPPVFGESF